MDPIERLNQFAASIPDVVELAGGYVRTDQGVQQERGAGAHFNRNTGKYVGAALGSIPGLGIGALIDRSRRKHNKLKTRVETVQASALGKGPVFSNSNRPN